MYSFKDKLEEEGFTVTAIDLPVPSPKAKEFRIICEKDMCSGYGTNWGCPPGVGTLEETAERLKSYSEAFLVRKRYVLDPKNKEETEQAADDIADSCRRAADTIRPFASVKVIGCGKCRYCGICTYPEDECRYPLQKIDSVTGYGLDIDHILKQIGAKLVFETDAMTPNAIILIEKIRS
ncbi:MAG TPA: DUF2284 domain-containing protein [Candidatus Methanomethylophilaceae archaeon]|nr:DUF2284 domain-containing protein [Candidatus Methanomethylophilaceae archaeon]